MPNTPPPDCPQGRAGNAKRCANCGKPLNPKRASRRMRVCSDACRQARYRTRKWASRYQGPQPLRSGRKTFVESKSCSGDFRDRGSDIHGPAVVVGRELSDGLIWRPVVSPDGVPVEVSRLGIARILEAEILRTVQDSPRAIEVLKGEIDSLDAHRDARETPHVPHADTESDFWRAKSNGVRAGKFKAGFGKFFAQRARLR